MILNIFSKASSLMNYAHIQIRPLAKKLQVRLYNGTIEMDTEGSLLHPLGICISIQASQSIISILSMVTIIVVTIDMFCLHKLLLKLL